MYTVALSQPRAVAIAAIAALEAGVLLGALRWSQGSVLEGFVGLSAMVIAAVALGINIRQRRALLGSLYERAARLELERDQQGRLATAAERARIAREMHDIVAHNLTVMIALADGAAYAIEEDPARARTAMETASRTGREALSDMRRLLDVLHDADDATSDGRAPQPGVERIAQLVEQVRTAGVAVSYETAGRPCAGLPAGMQLAAYRIVQEALTNVARHAEVREATVRVWARSQVLEVEVEDQGKGFDPASMPSSGSVGLAGMRERAIIVNGSLTIETSAGAGTRVAAELPLNGSGPAPP
jgi:signal transduction histidine kinase